MAKRSTTTMDDLERKIDRLQASLEKYETWESRFDDLMERKIFEVRTLSYVLLLITGVQLALTIGALYRQISGG